MRPCLLVMLLTSLTSQAQTAYMWVDENGDEQFAIDPKLIPKSAKPKRVEGLDTVTFTTAAPTLPALQVRQEVRKPADTEPDRRVREASERALEASWRAQFREAAKRISTLETEIAELRRKLNEADVTVSRQCLRSRNVNPRGMSVPVYGAPTNIVGCQSAAATAQLERMKSRLSEANSELVTARNAQQELERKASFEAVPREWRQ